MTARTYGTLELDPLGKTWRLHLEPAAAVRAKRVFGRVRQAAVGELTIANTIEVARDLEWFLSRWPIEPVDERTAVALAAGAEAHRERERAVARVLLNPPTLELPDGAVLKTPRPYQLAAVELLRARKRYLLTDEVGLGKTLTGLLNLVHEDARPALVVPPTHLPRRWATELAESMPHLTVQTAQTTKPTEEALAGDFPDVTIVPYSRLWGWSDALAGRMRSVVFDEVQDLRRGTETAKGGAAKLIADAATYVLGLTATPVYNYGGEAWQLLNIIAPGELGTAAEFTREWGHSTSNGHVHVADPAGLGSYLREQGLMLGRTRAEVGRDLPKAIKVPQFVNSDPAALASAAGNAAEMARLILADTTSRMDRFRAASEIDWRLREATGIAKAPFVAEFVRMLLESEQKVALFGWHRAVWDLWLEALAEFEPAMYTGSETAKQKAATEDRFINDPNCRVLCMSLRSGAGVDGLQKVCSVAVFGELDWTPAVHDQAIGRFRRDGMDETKPVVAYFLESEEGSDPILMQTLGIKRNQAEPIISPDGKLLQNTEADVHRGRALAKQILALAGEPVPDEGEAES